MSSIYSRFMKFNLIIIFLLISYANIAQSYFFKTYPRPSHERTFSSIQREDGTFILAGEIRIDGYTGTNEGYIVHLSQTGDIVKEILINSQNSSRMCLILPYASESFDLICIGSSDSIAGDEAFGRKSFYCLDSELNIVSEKHFSFVKNYTQYPWQYQIVNDSLLYLMTTYSINTLGTGQNSLIDVVKYKLPFDSLTSYSDTNYSVSLDLNYTLTSNQLNVFVFPFKRQLKFDENLNFISSRKYSDKFPTNISVTPISDSNYLITGAAFNLYSPNNLQIGCIRFNNNDVPLDSIFYTPNVDTNFYAGGRENTTISGNNIFIAGFYNVNAWMFPYNYNPSWVTVTKADLDLNIISTHFYGGNAQYGPFSIIPTSDGGCFITGYSYDYINNLPNGNYELDIFALKTDANGLITELPEQPQAKAHDAILYPNPGRENITIQSGPQINGAIFTLYDMQGRAVLYRNNN